MRVSRPKSFESYRSIRTRVQVYPRRFASSGIQKSESSEIMARFSAKWEKQKIDDDHLVSCFNFVKKSLNQPLENQGVQEIFSKFFSHRTQALQFITSRFLEENPHLKDTFLNGSTPQKNFLKGWALASAITSPTTIQDLLHSLNLPNNEDHRNAFIEILILETDYIFPGQFNIFRTQSSAFLNPAFLAKRLLLSEILKGRESKRYIVDFFVSLSFPLFALGSFVFLRHVANISAIYVGGAFGLLLSLYLGFEDFIKKSVRTRVSMFFLGQTALVFFGKLLTVEIEFELKNLLMFGPNILGYEKAMHVISQEPNLVRPRVLKLLKKHVEIATPLLKIFENFFFSDDRNAESMSAREIAILDKSLVKLESLTTKVRKQTL